MKRNEERKKVKGEKKAEGIIPFSFLLKRNHGGGFICILSYLIRAGFQVLGWEYIHIKQVRLVCA